MREAATVRVADVLRAALDVLSDEDYARLAARIDVIAEAPPEAKPYTLAELDALDAAATRVQLAVQALRYARKVREDASLRTFDAAEAQVQAAAQALAGMVRP